MPQITCPFCLQSHDTGAAATFTCSKYQQVIPASYIREYDTTPPLWLVTVGFPKHGKTTYLAALTLTLKDMSEVWPGSFSRDLDQYTMETARNWLRDARLGIQSASTATGIPRPLLMSISKIAGGGSRCLVMYDVAGEVYDKLHEVEEYVASIKQVSTTWFFVSLKDLQDRDQSRSLSELFTVYLTGMEGLHADLRGRNLIVVYTKGDQITDPVIRSYLLSDPLQALAAPASQRLNLGAFSMEEYYASLQKMSDTLRTYTRDEVPGGKPFVNMVESQGMNLVFSVTSALGEDPNADNRLSEDAHRYRILDPFLWAVRLERPEVKRSLALVLDASAAAHGLYNDVVLSDVWAQLSMKGEVSTYLLGSRRPLGNPGQSPSLTPPAIARPRLIGPVLERLPANTSTLVLTTGRILDLADYATTDWRRRLLVVGLDWEPDQDWEHALIHTSGTSATPLVDALMAIARN